MGRVVLFSLGLLAGIALSCQVLPPGERGAAPLAPATLNSRLTPAPTPLEEMIHVATPSAHVDLADTLEYIEGRTPTHEERQANERRDKVHSVVEHLQARHTGLSEREIQRVAETLVDECADHGLELQLILGVIQVESAAYHRAVSPVGARGLMQIMPATGEMLAQNHGMEWNGPDILFDPVVNVTLGIAYLQELSDRYDHIPTALAAYNWGPSRIDKRLRRGAGLPKIYVDQVMRAVDKVRAEQAANTTTAAS